MSIEACSIYTRTGGTPQTRRRRSLRFSSQLHSRGLPDFRGQAFKCPRSGENITVDMKTPRVVHRHGQSVYFCCFGCVTAFWMDPTSLIANVTAR